jgi:hypothetical protein
MRSYESGFLAVFLITIMNFISHRGLWADLGQTQLPQNSIAAFAASQKAGFGVETDLRIYRGDLYLSHDPIESSKGLVTLNSLLALWSKTPQLPLFLNIKEDGLLPMLHEKKVLLDRLEVVFFDMSIPELVQYSKVFSKNQLATRVSEFEEHPAAQDLCSWLWVDGFFRDYDPVKLQKLLGNQQFKIAVVSSELHQRSPQPHWNSLKQLSKKTHPEFTLCTDFPNKASRYLA